MPAPSASLATQRPDLGGSLEEFDLAMDREGFIGHRVMPVFDSGVQAGTFGRIPLEELLQTRDTKRSPRSGYSRGDWNFETDSFSCEEHGHEEAVDDNEARMYKDYFRAEEIATARAYDAVLRNAEIRVASALYNTTTFTGSALTTALSNEWDDATNATPITDVDTACRVMWDNSGLWPNALVLNYKQFKNLRLCDQVTDAIASSGAGDSILQSRITAAMVAQALDLDFLLIGKAAKNTAAKGQSASISPVWSDEYAMLCRIATTDDLSEPCIGRTIHWADDGSEVDGRVESYRDESVRGDRVRVRHQVDEKVMYVQAGHLFSNVTA